MLGGAVPNIDKLRAKGNVKGLAKALSHKEWSTRAEAAFALGKLGDPAAVGPLIAALGDPQTQVRSSARWALVEIGIAGPLIGDVRARVATLERAEGLGVLVYCVEALGEIGDPEATESIVALLEGIGGSGIPGGNRILLREAAVTAFGKLGGPDARTAVAAIAEGRYEDRVLTAARKALALIDGHETAAARPDPWALAEARFRAAPGLQHRCPACRDAELEIAGRSLGEGVLDLACPSCGHTAVFIGED